MALLEATFETGWRFSRPEVRRALIVSTEPEDRKTLARILAGCGFECSLCSMVEEAEAAIDSGEFSVIFCQESLVGGGFLDVMRAANFGGRNIPVVVCARLYCTNAYLHAMAMGAYDFVVSPYQKFDVEWIAEGALRRLGEPQRKTARKAA